MADLLNPDTSHERATLRTLLLAALCLIVLAAAGFGIFYHRQNHAPLQLSSTKTLALNVHTTYTRPNHAAGTEDGGDDTTYIAASIHVTDLADAPLFLKDITATLTLADGTPVQITRVRSSDQDRLLHIVPAVVPLLQQIGVPPLQPEQTIAPRTSADGYVLLLFAGPKSAWDSRKDATLTVDFYHQDSVTTTIH